jgi:RHS repeat-associated protein
MKYKLTFALVASLTSTAFAAFQAPLPEFKNEKQLAEWRAEKASEATSQGYAAEEVAFYTGRPYLALSGGYVFKYRSFNPELARWTSEDPSGFPDGANQSFYAPTPTSQFDYCGLNSGDLARVGAVVEAWKTLDFTYSIRLAEHSLKTGDDRTADADEISSLYTSNKLSALFKKSYFEAKYSAGITTGTGLVDYSGINDLGHSYGRVGFDYTISLSGRSSYSVDFSFEDIYDFNPASNNSAIRSFNRLQQAGIASIYTTSGTFNKFYE